MNKQKLEIYKLCDQARYADNLENVINFLNGEKVLRIEFESDYQGFVDIDVLLKDGRIFSYKYDYGSCSGCDDWEARELDDNEIENEMKEAATFFDNIKLYESWRAECKE